MGFVSRIGADKIELPLHLKKGFNEETIPGSIEAREHGNLTVFLLEMGQVSNKALISAHKFQVLGIILSYF